MLSSFYVFSILLFVGAFGLDYYGEDVMSPSDILGSRGDQAYYTAQNGDEILEGEYPDDGHNGDELLEVEYPEYGVSSGDNENIIANELQRYHDNLFALFGYKEDLIEDFYKDLENPSYLRLAEVKFYILQAMNKLNDYSRLNSTQKDEIFQLVAILEQEMSELARVENNKWLVDRFLEQGMELTAVLPANIVVKHLEELMGGIAHDSWRCDSGYFVNLWREIVDMDPDPDNIDDTDALDKAIVAVVQIGQAVINTTVLKGRMSDGDGKLTSHRTNLLILLSRTRNREFFTRYLGGVQQLEDLVQSIICEEFRLKLVERVMQQLTAFSGDPAFSNRLITNPEDMDVLIEMQTALGDITRDVAAAEKGRISMNRMTVANLGQTILESYMDLIENTMNEEAAKIWAQMSIEEANDKLHHLLLRNERYVGSMSEVVLDNMAGHHENYTLEKDSLSVSISKVQLQENNNTAEEFKYGDTLIKTESMELLDIADGDDLRVYTLRYKSWSHMIHDILLKHSDLDEGNSTESGTHTRHKRMIDSSVEDIARNKSFVGKGGIVSLSTRQNGVKRSLPVTYWIGFEEGTISGGHKTLCLSCEYLDPDTVTWETQGCYIEKVDDNGITCKCNHTTNFAAFMMPAEMTFKLTEDEEMTVKILSMVGSFLSITGLVSSLTVFFLVRHLIRNERLKAHIHLSFALLATHVTFLLGDLLVMNNTLCVISTVVSHFFLMASFMWMLIEGIFLYLYVVQVFLRSKIASYNWMYLVGWGIPAIVVVVSAGYGIANDIYVMPSKPVNESDHIQCPDDHVPHAFAVSKYSHCWLSHESGIIWSFLVPAAMVLTFNAVIMCKTLIICVQSLRNSQVMRSRTRVYNGKGKFVTVGSSSDKTSESNRHDDSYDHLHGQTKTVTRPIVSGSPCLLQVTTEEEEKSKALLDHGDDDSSISSGDNATVSKDAPATLLKSDDAGSLGIPSRCHSVAAEQAKISTKRASVVYRNSIGNHSPSVVAKPQSFGNKMAQLSLERVKFFRDAKAAVKGAIILLPILGVPWILGFLTHLSPAVMYIFVILNSTQGVAIFVVYCLCNGEVRRAVKRRSAIRSMKHSVDSGIRRTSSTSTARSFLGFGRRRSTLTTST